MMIMLQIERSIHFLQALVVDDATEGEEELQAQLAADPRLPVAWAALLAEDSISVRGVLDMPLVWVEPDVRRHKKRDANKLLKLWKYALLMHTPPGTSSCYIRLHEMKVGECCRGAGSPHSSEDRRH